MRLLDLSLRRVRRHRELQLDFAAGFTLIGGANETGKSTLVDALHKGLFLKATATGRGVEELRSRLHPGLPEVEIGFSAAGRTWRLRKRFAGGGGTCQLSHDGGLRLSGAEAEEELARILGVEGAVEGRRIAQLPLRWAHLWVRQGEAGANLLSAPAEAYDLARLVEQLQRGEGAGTALESTLDRRVIELVHQQLEQQFTATGKVRAGSPLAQARAALEQLGQQLDAALERRDQLESSLEELRLIDERVQEIEQRLVPALEQQRRHQGERQLLLAQLRPLEEQHEQLRQHLDELLALQQQRRQQQDRRQQLLAEQRLQQEGLAKGKEEIARLERLGRQLAEALATNQGLGQLAQVLLDQEQLEREERQRQAHQASFTALQQQAEELKRQLTGLAPIGPEQLVTLRQAQRRLAEAEAQRQARAVHLDLLSADLPVQLDGVALRPGTPVELLQSGELAVGSGVRLRLSPGGGGAPQQVRQQWQACREAMEQQLAQLQVKDLDEAEAMAARRTTLEAELQQLRQAAAAIPWARLQQDAEEQGRRRRRLEAALDSQAALLEQQRQSGELPQSREQRELWRERLAAAAADLEEQRRSCANELEQGQRQLAEQDRQQRSREQELQLLLGSSAALEERLNRLHSAHGEQATLETELARRSEELSGQRAALAQLDRQIGTGQTGEPEALLSQLQAEKEALLLRRGQHQQAVLSLSAEDPAAAVEQLQASREQAEAELSRLELQTRALQRLMQQFEAARSDLASRYSRPLSLAVGRYLDALACPAYTPDLDYAPSQGFSNLQLRQGEEGFSFEELSGGMREQLNAALRLAIAEALAPAYDGTLPLLFDDAFTNSDPLRQEGLQRMLRQAVASGLQVVLLSCTPEQYAGLLEPGGLQHRLEG